MNIVETPASNTSSKGKGGKYLTFKLGREEYGLSLIRVREIIALMDITSVPLAPSSVRGVMNLRGRIIPVVDLRRRFEMSDTPDHDRKCIIVVDVELSGSPIQMSILVDEVSEVLYIASDEIEDAPAFQTGVNSAFIHGIATTKSGVKVLLNVDIILANIASNLPHRTSTTANTGTEGSAAPTA